MILSRCDFENFEEEELLAYCHKFFTAKSVINESDHNIGSLKFLKMLIGEVKKDKLVAKKELVINGKSAKKTIKAKTRPNK